MKNKIYQTIKSSWWIMLLILIILYVVIKIFMYKEINQYELSKLHDDMYITKQTVKSNIPAENYNIITMCISNNVYTYDGSVNIIYIKDDITPYVIWTKTKIVHGDNLKIYIQEDKIKYLDTLILSGR